MGDMGDFFNDLKAFQKARKHGFLQAFEGTDLAKAFHRHSHYHFSTMLDGHCLEYWPSTNRWRWRSRSYWGTARDLERFIAKRSAVP